MAVVSRDRSIFINCPFDPGFAPIFDALVFSILFCGFTVRSAMEVADSGDLRLIKIMRLLEQSRFSLHDISRVELDGDSGLPRFNMPIELGMAIGMKHLGRARLRDHCMLVLDSEKYRYQKFASDLAGTDIAAHGGKPARAIRATRNFLATHASAALPGEDVIVEALRAFDLALPTMASAARQNVDKLTYSDRLFHINDFIGSSI